MLYTIMNLDFVTHDYTVCGRNKIYEKQTAPSSNPYDYIRPGYFLDNAKLFGGENNVNYNCYFKRLASGYRMDSANK